MTGRAYASFASVLARCAVVVVLARTPALAEASICAQAADVVEQRLGLPNGLLRSIGEVETGNRPWSVDSDGIGTNFSSADEAIAFVRSSTGSARYVDVGCFQIDLAFHAEAFRTLDDAFDPLANAIAAGRYLLALRRGASSWTDAVARYHSGLPGRGDAYASRVYASLEIGGEAAANRSMPPIDGIRVIVPVAYQAARGGRHRASQRLGLPVVVTP